MPVLHGKNVAHLGTLLAATADALLDGSRGNSGAIVAQFFQGLSDSAGELTRFTPYTFSNAFAQGNDYAHDALSQPREGTILTVMAAVSRAMKSHIAGPSDGDGEFPGLMQAALESRAVLGQGSGHRQSHDKCARRNRC